MSEFKFACPVCGQHITCDSSSSGTQMDCPTCFRKLVVPQAKSAGSSSLVLTAALVQSRPATAVSSQTEFIAASRSGGKRFPVAALVLVLLVAGASAGVFVFRKTILHAVKSDPANASKSAQPAKPVVTVIPPAPDATNWTLNLTEAKIPDDPANGAVHGRGFELDRATIQQGRLDLRQGPKWPPDVGVSVHLFAERTEDLAKRAVTIEANRTNGPKMNGPRMILRWKNEQGDPVTKDFHEGYALKVEFGQVVSNRLPGKIFIAFPDDSKSYVAGTFNAEIRRPAKK